ncbi:hypothetical protein NDI76_15905 [Halogeometricum sp. S1BR25-6]|uniref:Lasso RiPP family leader peptide-containing protein n=1 Tax=Halogeometricum salsisoli TaxID=2950536 RepID=A0ABU2GHF9_9EURY|nr:hypothetical protein [Halogeometricum sp. S1BR25-6]MDS0300232.1 hypothetical protein [Halogeometricum sp. S1BR25-6]
MAGNSSKKSYTAPEVTEYGNIETITKQKNKTGMGNDQYSKNTPLVGSVVSVEN